MHLHHDSLAVLPPAGIAFCDILTQACAEIKVLIYVYVFRLLDFWNFFFRLFFFSFSFLFAAVIVLLLGLLGVKKLLRKRHRNGQFLPWQQIVVWVFRCTFWAFLCISPPCMSGSIRPITLVRASLERSFRPAEVEHRWCQFWSKVMTSDVEERPRLVTAGYGWHGSQWVKER